MNHISMSSSCCHHVSCEHICCKRLCYFNRNIEELQEQNQRLLAVIRELSEEKEQDEQREKSNLA